LATGTLLRRAELVCARGSAARYRRYELIAESGMTLGTILVIILILILLGVFPRWGYSSGWGYGPSGLVGVVLIIVLILVLLGRV
jgi:hypothetical protein